MHPRLKQGDLLTFLPPNSETRCFLISILSYSTRPLLKLLPPVAHVCTMSGSPEKPWSSDLNAPQIVYGLYLAEKSNFAGVILSAALYGTQLRPSIRPSVLILSFRSIILGIVVAQFFRCMGALLNRTGGISSGDLLPTPC